MSATCLPLFGSIAASPPSPCPTQRRWEALSCRTLSASSLRSTAAVLQRCAGVQSTRAIPVVGHGQPIGFRSEADSLGLGKNEVKRWLFEHGRMPAEQLRRSWLWSTMARRDGWPQWVRAAAEREGTEPAVRAPEDITIVVAGGDLEIPQHAYFPSWGFPPCRVMAEDQEVLTVKDVCDLLRVHPTTLYKMARQGKIPSSRVGTEWRFRKDAILRWMAEKSTHARQVRATVNSRVNGEVQHRRMAGSRGRRR
jgi:excisionase family DNA binding protein